MQHAHTCFQEIPFLIFGCSRHYVTFPQSFNSRFPFKFTPHLAPSHPEFISLFFFHFTNLFQCSHPPFCDMSLPPVNAYDALSDVKDSFCHNYERSKLKLASNITICVYLDTGGVLVLAPILMSFYSVLLDINAVHEEPFTIMHANQVQ